MKTQYLDSSIPLHAEAGISWRLIAENQVLTDKVLKPYSTLRITAIAAPVKVTIDGVDSIVLLAGQTAIINTGLGDPNDKKTVKVTTSAACHVSVHIDAPIDRLQQSVE